MSEKITFPFKKTNNRVHKLSITYPVLYVGQKLENLVKKEVIRIGVTSMTIFNVILNCYHLISNRN